MGDVLDITAEREKRQRKITTGNRSTSRTPSRIEQVIHQQREIERPRRGDPVETIKGRAFVMNDELLTWCKGEAFYLTPEMIVQPGVTAPGRAP